VNASNGITWWWGYYYKWREGIGSREDKPSSQNGEIPFVL